MSPVTGTTAYRYDLAGNLTTSTDANTAMTTRTHDAMGRILTATSIRGQSEEIVAWTYDDPAPGRFGKGRRASMTDPAGTTAYAYERRGLLRSEERSFAGAAGTATSTFSWDADGNRAGVGYASGMTVAYTNDYAGRPYSARSVIGSNALQIVSDASYRPFGPLRQISYGNGTAQTMEFDARYRMTENKLTLAGATIAEYDYDYNAERNVTGIADAVDPAYSRTFGYDELDRLTTTGRERKSAITSHAGTGRRSGDTRPPIHSLLERQTHTHMLSSILSGSPIP